MGVFVYLSDNQGAHLRSDGSLQWFRRHPVRGWEETHSPALTEEDRDRISSVKQQQGVK